MLNRKIKVLAIASAGGHWVELRRISPVWDECLVTYVTTSISRKKEIDEEAAGSGNPSPEFYVVVEASRWQKWKLIRQLLQIVKILLTVRPDIVISTGAAAGYFAVRFGKLLGARTIWIDSIANAHELSLSGRKVQAFADLWLTQWEHLAGPAGDPAKPRYEGKVI
jgi:UDP-N-acetylglucosamine:LPS N-acetylglucosamine transferase